MLWWLVQRSRARLKKAFSPDAWAFLFVGWSPRIHHLRWVLRFLAVGFLLLALARPQGGEQQQTLKSRGIEIVALVDVSESMLAEDLQPSRLAQARLDLIRLMELQKSSQIGLVAFAGSATLLSPLTKDPGALRMYIDSLSPLSVSSQGTVFSAALAEAREAFERGGTTSDELNQVTRVILVLSDGEDHEPGAIDLAQKLRQDGYFIFTIAYGTEKGAPIPQRDAMGFLRGNRKDESGEVIWTKVQGQALQKLAEVGQGQFLFARPGSSHMEDLNASLGLLEQKDFETQSSAFTKEWFQTPLAIAMLLLLLDLFLIEKSRSRARWMGRLPGGTS